jgi:hypothetical protein
MDNRYNGQPLSLHFNMPKSNAAVEKKPENGNLSLITNSKEKI